MRYAYLNSALINQAGYLRYLGWRDSITATTTAGGLSADDRTLALLDSVIAENYSHASVERYHVSTDWSTLSLHASSLVRLHRDQARIGYISDDLDAYLLLFAIYLTAFTQLNSYAASEDDHGSPHIFPHNGKNGADTEYLTTLAGARRALSEAGIILTCEQITPDTPLARLVTDLHWC